MNQALLLGKILATVATAAIDAGAIMVSPLGVLENPAALGSIIGGFLSIWQTHPASGATQPAATQQLPQAQQSMPAAPSPLVPSGPK